MDHIYGTFWPPVHPPAVPNSGPATAIFHHLWRIMTMNIYELCCLCNLCKLSIVEHSPLELSHIWADLSMCFTTCAEPGQWERLLRPLEMERLLQTGSIRAKAEATDFEAASDMSGVIHSLGTSAFGALLTFEREKKPSHVTPDGFANVFGKCLEPTGPFAPAAENSSQ